MRDDGSATMGSATFAASSLVRTQPGRGTVSRRSAARPVGVPSGSPRPSTCLPICRLERVVGQRAGWPAPVEAAMLARAVWAFPDAPVA